MIVGDTRSVALGMLPSFCVEKELFRAGNDDWSVGCLDNKPLTLLNGVRQPVRCTRFTLYMKALRYLLLPCRRQPEDQRGDDEDGGYDDRQLRRTNRFVVEHTYAFVGATA